LRGTNRAEECQRETSDEQSHIVTPPA